MHRLPWFGAEAFQRGVVTLTTLSVLDIQLKLATHAAVFTGGADLSGLACPALETALFLIERTHRAEAHAFAAEHAT